MQSRDFLVDRYCRCVIVHVSLAATFGTFENTRAN